MLAFSRNLTPLGVIDAIEGRKGYYILDIFGDGLQIFEFSGEFTPFMKKLSKGIRKALRYKAAIDFLTDYRDDPEVIWEYTKLTTRLGACLSDADVHARIQEAIDIVNKKRKERAKEASDKLIEEIKKNQFKELKERSVGNEIRLRTANVPVE